MKKSRRGGERASTERSTSGKPMQTKTPRYAKTRRKAAAPKAGATKASATKTGATKASATKTSATKTLATKTGATKAGATKTGATNTSIGEPRSAAGTGAPKLVGTAGRKILGHLGLTDAELFAFLPADASPLVRSVLWCQFDLSRSLEEIEAHFRGRYETSMHDDVKFPVDGPEEGISVRSVTVRPEGRYVAYTFYGMRDDAYVESGSYQLEASFRESGATWGSNRAIYERFKALELPGLGATNVRERTE